MKASKKSIPNQIVTFGGITINYANKYAVQSRCDRTYTNEDDNSKETWKSEWYTIKCFKLLDSAIDCFKSQITTGYYTWADKINPDRYSNIEHRIIKVEETEDFKKYYL